MVIEWNRGRRKVILSVYGNIPQIVHLVDDKYAPVYIDPCIHNAYTHIISSPISIRAMPIQTHDFSCPALQTLYPVNLVQIVTFALLLVFRGVWCLEIWRPLWTNRLEISNCVTDHSMVTIPTN